jgi:hypothetical protein
LDSFLDVLWGESGKLIREIETAPSTLDDSDVGDSKCGIQALSTQISLAIFLRRKKDLGERTTAKTMR